MINVGTPAQRKKLKTISVIIIASFALSSCGYYYISHHNIRNRIPNLERSDLDWEPTLAGIDADSNGIRDDVERFIDRHYETEPQKRAVRQLARTFQESLLIDHVLLRVLWNQ